MRLTKLTGHAMRILVHCAEHDDALVTASEIGEKLSITQQNVLKLVHILSHAGFLTAVRGRGGGVRLSRPATEIRIGDVVRATEVTSVEIESEASHDAAPIAAVLDTALEAFISVLDGHTLAEVVSKGERKRRKVAGAAPTVKTSSRRPRARS